MSTYLLETNDLLIDKIKAALYREYATDKMSADISLFLGDTGILLLQAILHEISPESQLRTVLEINFNNILDTIESATAIIPTYADGLAGVGTLVQQLSEDSLLDVDAGEFCEDLDQYLSTVLDQMLKRKEFDPLHGAIGLAGYFLKRNKEQQVISVLQVLYEQAERHGGELRWAYYYKDFKRKVYDFGASHGMAGTIRFLVQCHRKGIMPAACREMIDGALSFYQEHIQDPLVAGSYFPNFIYCDTPSLRTSEKSRIAWCYGDAGIIYQLFTAAGEIKNIVLQQQFEKMLETTAGRREQRDTMVTDAAFCHGSTGPGLLFWLLFQSTRNGVFEEAFRHWKNVTLGYMEELDALQNGEALFSSEPYIKDVRRKGIFTGLAGIGIFVAITESPQQIQQRFIDHWKDIFLL